MARILYWNIKNFTDKRINAAKRKKVRSDDDYGSLPQGHQLRDAILSTLKHPQDGANPIQLDFIVLVEVVGTAGNAVEGQLVSGDAEAGVLSLLQLLRQNVPGQNNWMLVPPVVTGTGGKREGIAVYYRSDRWHFLGPNSWGGAYPQAWNNTLPNGNIPGGYPFRANQPFNQGTGVRVYRNIANTADVTFPAAADRKPWYTAFGDVGNANNLIRLFALHTSPDTADQATTNLVATQLIGAQPIDAANQIDLVVGDYNVDNLTPANFAGGGPYAGLLGLAPPYTPLIQPPVGLLAQYYSYYDTIGREAAEDGKGDAKIMDDDDVLPVWDGEYPGLQYTEISVDNALVRYRGGAAPPGNPHTTILSRARQLPYHAPIPPAAIVPMLGYFSAAPRMEQTMEDLLNLRTQHPDWQNVFDMNKDYFRQWPYYGRLRSVSDHFPIIFDI